jgi:predicted nucleotidyltransferase
MMSHETDWIVQRHLLREHGIVITGPDLKDLIDPVSPDELRQAVADVLPLWVGPILADPSRIDERGYQSFVVLTLCRMLYTLKHGRIFSKPAAAQWAIQTLDAKWKPLIERSLMGRQKPTMAAGAGDIHGTLGMIRYTLGQIKPTAYIEVNEVLNLLLANVKQLLGEQFIGMYLYGPLASGDFNLETSDIDFLIVTTDILRDDKMADLEAMHHEIWRSGFEWAAKLEGSYIPGELVRRHDPDGPPSPNVNEGKFFIDKRGSDWIIQRHVVREHGVVVDAPDPKTLIDYVSPGDLRGAVLGTLQEWWFPMLDEPAWLRQHGSGYHAYAVISMCRALYTLRHGTIVSKPKAIQWARSQHQPWVRLIDKAVAA